jgi:hypothetical protein
VHVTELEVRHIANVVKRMPESRQSRIRQRFADSQATLAAAGLEEPLKEITNLYKESHRDIGVKYFSFCLNCPFRRKITGLDAYVVLPRLGEIRQEKAEKKSVKQWLQEFVSLRTNRRL